MKLCKCGQKIDYIYKYCSECESKVEQEKTDRVKRYDREVRNSDSNKRYTEFYNSKAWRTLSEVVKSNFNGLCAICEDEGRLLTQSDTTHHIEELKENWNLRLVEDNLIPLCHDCHNNLHTDYKEKNKKHLKHIILKYKDKF